LKGAKKGCPTYPQGSPDEVGSHITRRFMVVKRRTMNTATRQFVPKKKEGCRNAQTTSLFQKREEGYFTGAALRL